MLAKRTALWLLTTTVLLALLTTQCVAATSEAPSATEAPTSVEVAVTTEQPVTEEAAAAEPELVTFMSWAEDAFEVEALDQLIESFKAQHPDVTVECEVVTFVDADMDNCAVNVP